MKKDRNDPLVYFIVVGWNNKSLLNECFGSISCQTYSNLRTIYVDNGSNDGSLVYVKKHFPEVVIVDAQENLGFAIGNNIGIKKALTDQECKYVALLNTDARLDKGWLEGLINFAEKHPNSASFQAPTYDYYDHSILDSYGITIDHCGRATQLGYRQVNPKLSTKIVFGTNAAASLYSRSFLDTQPFGDDYFDPDLWMYLEDVDLAARAAVMGWTNWLVNESRAYHMGSASSSKNPGFSVYMIYRNNLPMLFKNLHSSIIIRIIPGLLITDTQTVLGLLRARNFKIFKYLIKGRLASIPLTLKFVRKRQRLNVYRKHVVTASSLSAVMNSK